MSNKIVKANKGKIGNVNDKVYTPVRIAVKLVDLLPLKYNNRVVEPCRGTGNFENAIITKINPFTYDWFEIEQGKDFFECDKHYDWCISNPPYSIFDSFVDKCFEVADNVCLLVPLSKIVSSMGRIKNLMKYGNAKHIWVLPASQCGFNFGFPCAFVWFKKGYNGQIEFEVLE